MKEYTEMEARQIIQRIFSKHPALARNVYHVFYVSPRALHENDIRMQFLPDATAAVTVANIMRKYPLERPLLKTISAYDICRRYLEDRWRDVPPGILSAKIREQIIRKMKPANHRGVKGPYRYVRENQILPTALYFLEEGQKILGGKFAEQIVSEIHDVSGILISPVLKDLQEIERRKKSKR